MSQEILRGQGYGELRAGFHHALTGQARIDARIYGAVDEVFFFIADFRQLVAAFFHVDVAGTAPAHAPAIVLELDSVVQGHVEHRLAGNSHVGLGRLAILKLERNGGGGHESEFLK